MQEEEIFKIETLSLDNKENNESTSETTDKKTLTILRGLPGSGKSTLSKELSGENGVIFSTDDFFMKDGKYVFDPTEIGNAHKWNQQRAKQAIEDNLNNIIIDNTNTQAWEAKPYIEIGLAAGYNIEIREPTTSWAKDPVELANKNAHGVPLEAIHRMLDRWEEFTVESCLVAEPPQRGGKHYNSFRKKYISTFSTVT